MLFRDTALSTSTRTYSSIKIIRTNLIMLKKLSVALVGAALMSVGIAPAVQAEKFHIEVLANGLDSPRGLTFGPDGALYVTEAGRGGDGACIPSPSQPGAELCYGASSALTRIKDGKSERIVTGLPSVALPDGSDASGAHDIAFDSTGKPYILFGLAGNPGDRENLLGIPDFGQL
ncbi:hypothetical protein B7486_69705, partial [cyanobacterium TDX16]